MLFYCFPKLNGAFRPIFRMITSTLLSLLLEIGMFQPPPPPHPIFLSLSANRKLVCQFNWQLCSYIVKRWHCFVYSILGNSKVHSLHVSQTLHTHTKNHHFTSDLWHDTSADFESISFENCISLVQIMYLYGNSIEIVFYWEYKALFATIVKIDKANW